MLYTVTIEIEMPNDTSELVARDQAEGDVANLRMAVKLVDYPAGATVTIKVMPQI